ncbi:hypothetical protein PsorP6_011640 [Peronosclerospora sorghi]|uniref:Uncharacterized protein n=1 Tax=Peronosclerospora sorghi TaxID=230839 RepID=A0ACC0WJM8_9STRA|nr:hypothetical protein PsorP6_011640 [Peronosclerospora sorghi]
MMRLKESKSILHQLVSARDFVRGTEKQKESRRKVMDSICDENFVTNLNKSIAILEPIEVGVNAFQNDQISLSMVYKHFALSMPESYENMICLSNEERLAACFMYGDEIGIAYLLDPVIIGDVVLDEHKVQAEDSLLDSISRGISITDVNRKDIEQKKEQLFVGYTKWILKAHQYRTKNDFRFKMLSKGRKTTMQYWLVDGATYPILRDVAVMVTSSEASERGFSAMAFVHSKVRNRLSGEKVKKLFFIKNNAPQLISGQAGVDWGTCDGEDDEVEAEDITSDD